jgi:two-component system, sensor histidine kinase and response regulator
VETAFRVLSEPAPELVARVGKDQHLEYVSEACRQLLGFEPEELVGKRQNTLVHPDDMVRLQDKLAALLEGERGEFQVTARMRHKDGSYRWLDISVYGLPRDQHGQPQGLFATARDASHRAAAEQSEERLKRLLDAVPGMVLQWLVHPDGRSEYLYVNDWPRTALGIDTSQLDELNANLSKLAEPEDMLRGWELAKRAIQTLEPWVWNGRFHAREGETTHVVGHTTPERQADGSVVFTGALLDDTARRRAEQALHESEELFKTVIDNMEMTHVRFDLEGVIQLVNPAGVRLFGYDGAAGLIGQNAGKQLWLSPARYQEVQARVLSEGSASIECPLKRRDGSPRTVQGALRLWRDASGNARAIDGILRDVTDELLAREELVSAREAAEAGSRAKSSFLANMSHEIRTPMNAIIGLSHLALDANPPPKQREYLTQIRAAALALLDILNDILDVSKIEAGKLAIELAPFELDRVLESVANVISVRADDRHLELGFSIDPRVPEQLLGDRMRLGQVLLNLASNAVKFTDRGDIVLAVELISREADQLRLRFSVSDTGIGMSEDQQKQLFQPFSQVDSSTTRRHSGTGLGLAISQQLVHMMGGEISVESRLGRGSRFSFELTLGVPQAEQPDKPRGIMAVRDLRVLVVDDNQVARDLLTRSLLAMNVAVCSVSSGETALDTLRDAERRSAPFQLALIDARMPGMSGAELSAAIHRHPQLAEPPDIVIISAHTREEVESQEDLSLVRAFLRKPISRSTLLATIIEVAEQRRPRSKSPAIPIERARRTPLAGLRLLVVEDNEINQILARDLLEAEGASVTIASDGYQAVRLAGEDDKQFDVILMDVQMPGMDGHATTRVLRAQAKTKHTPIIAMTAHAFEAERKQCLESGMSAHVAKPISPPELVQAILTWSGAKRPPPEEPKPAVKPIESKAFDPGALASVFREPERQLAFLRKFVESARAALRALKPAWEQRDLEQIGFAGHKLKSSAKACGAHALAAVLSDYEKFAKAKDWNRVAPLQGVAEQLLEEIALHVEGIPDGAAFAAANERG